ncbi:unnamed protein product [Effrenium voratum]|nr:unnamed protein product [Effrenium voratum]
MRGLSLLHLLAGDRTTDPIFKLPKLQARAQVRVVWPVIAGADESDLHRLRLTTHPSEALLLPLAAQPLPGKCTERCPKAFGASLLKVRAASRDPAKCKVPLPFWPNLFVRSTWAAGLPDLDSDTAMAATVFDDFSVSWPGLFPEQMLLALLVRQASKALGQVSHCPCQLQRFAVQMGSLSSCTSVACSPRVCHGFCKMDTALALSLSFGPAAFTTHQGTMCLEHRPRTLCAVAELFGARKFMQAWMLTCSASMVRAASGTLEPPS